MKKTYWLFLVICATSFAQETTFAQQESTDDSPCVIRPSIHDGWPLGAHKACSRAGAPQVAYADWYIPAA